MIRIPSITNKAAFDQFYIYDPKDMPALSKTQFSQIKQIVSDAVVSSFFKFDSKQEEMNTGIAISIAILVLGLIGGYFGYMITGDATVGIDAGFSSAGVAFFGGCAVKPLSNWIKYSWMSSTCAELGRFKEKIVEIIEAQAMEREGWGCKRASAYHDAAAFLDNYSEIQMRMDARPEENCH